MLQENALQFKCIKELVLRRGWLYLSNRKAERKWSHSFLLADFAGTACCSHFGVNHFCGSPKYFN